MVKENNCDDGDVKLFQKIIGGYGGYGCGTLMVVLRRVRVVLVP